MPSTGGTPRPFLPRRHQHARLVSGRQRASSTSTRPTATIRSIVADRTGADARPDPRARAAEEHESGLVAGRPVDLLRPRIGAAGRDGDGRVAPSPLGRIAGAGDDAAPGHQFPGAARPAHAALRGARGGPVGAVAVVARRRERSVDAACLRASINTRRSSTSRDGRRIVATVANPSASLWRVPLLDRLADERDAQPYPLPEPTGIALAPRFGGTSLFYLSARGTARRPVEGRGWEGRRRSGGASTGRCPSRPPSRRTDATGRRRQKGGKTAPVDHVGRRHERTNAGAVHRR